jgi:malonyl CoA-acyl carrier protein transacylase
MACNAKTTTAQLTSYLGLSDGRIRKLLIELAKKNLINKVGDNRYAHYVLTGTDE